MTTRATSHRIRRRKHTDLEACAGVLAEVHAADGYPLNWPDRPTEWLSPPGLLTAWVAERAGRVAGHIGLSCNGTSDAAPAVWSRHTGVPAETTAVISRLFVSPTARGHGIGARLLTHAARAAHALSLHPVLDVAASDKTATALYDRLGWTHLATVNQQWSPTQTVPVHCYAAPAPTAHRYWRTAQAVPADSATGRQLALMRDLSSGRVPPEGFATLWLGARREALRVGERISPALSHELDQVFYALDDYPIDPDLRESDDVTDAELRAVVRQALAALDGRERKAPR
ncbi:GNAT family N-acetyltransferase [Streptomyces sp. NPDC088762]|uniref:GNAT family N-acetyltransferase n=1 Tax=Streptomyces sp. NPDC088762 TaxID=3365891 RepID=UPI0037FFBA9D